MVPGYEVEAQIGAGGGALVFRARQLSVDAAVALKVLRDSLSESERRRAAEERRILGALRSHPHIVTVFDAGVTADGRDWVAMELLEGGSLAERLEREGSLSVAEVVEVGVAVGGALAAAHELGLVHRDVKPANVLVDGSGVVKLADFGIARTAAGVTTDAAYTPGYAAPEVFSDQPVGPPADVFSLAVTLYELASGRQPFAAEDDSHPFAVVHRLLNEEPVALTQLGVPGPVAEVIAAGMAKDPAERPSMMEFVARLQAAGMPEQLRWLGIAGLQPGVRAGGGGFGTVYRAHQPLIGRDVAVKVLAAPLADEAARRAFERECRALGRLSQHPGIVTLLDAGVTEDGRPYLLMPWLAGGSLQERLDREGALPSGEVVGIAVGLAQALQAAHGQGVLHMDLKPDNVLLDDEGIPQLVDFGIARLAGHTTMSTSGSVKGTPLYLAPEVLRGEPVTPAADVFSLGALLYTLVAGVPAFGGPGGTYAVLRRVMDADPPPLPDHVPAALRRLIMRAMAKDPAQRPALEEIVALTLPPADTPAATSTERDDDGGDDVSDGGDDGIDVAEHGPAAPVERPPARPAAVPARSAPRPSSGSTTAQAPTIRTAPPADPTPATPPRRRPTRRTTVGAVAVLAVVALTYTVVADNPNAGPGPASLLHGLPSGHITTIAGTGERGAGGDGGPAIDAPLGFPSDVAVTEDGTILIVESGNHRVRAVTPDGVITTVAGTGERVFGEDGEPVPGRDDVLATDSELVQPEAVTVAEDGTILVADAQNPRLRAVAPDGIITTVAGTGEPGSGGDGGPAIDAELGFPAGVAVTEDGTILIADSHNHRLRAVAPDGIVTTVAGTGEAGFGGDGGPATDARLVSPVDVAVAGDGTVLIADLDSHRLRAVAPDGVITTVAGTGEPGFGGDGGPATDARLAFPVGVAVAGDGTILIADAGNHRIRAVTPGGVIMTVAGTGEEGFGGDGGPATDARFDNPSGVAVAGDGTILIVEPLNHRVRAIAP